MDISYTHENNVCFCSMDFVPKIITKRKKCALLWVTICDRRRRLSTTSSLSVARNNREIVDDDGDYL